MLAVPPVSTLIESRRSLVISNRLMLTSNVSPVAMSA
jgi:hypothetical protein